MKYNADLTDMKSNDAFKHWKKSQSKRFYKL